MMIRLVLLFLFFSTAYATCSQDGDTVTIDHVGDINFDPRENQGSSSMYYCQNYVKADVKHLIILSATSISRTNFFDINNNPALETIVANSITSITNNNVFKNSNLISVEMNNLETVSGTNVLAFTTALTSVSFPALKSVGNAFLMDAATITTIDLPALTTVGDSFLRSTTALTSVSFPALTSVGGWFLINSGITTISLPALTTVGDDFLTGNTITSLYFPVLTTIGDNFMLAGASSPPSDYTSSSFKWNIYCKDWYEALEVAASDQIKGTMAAAVAGMPIGTTCPEGRTDRCIKNEYVNV